VLGTECDPASQIEFTSGTSEALQMFEPAQDGTRKRKEMKLGLRPQAESNSHYPTIGSGLQKSYWKLETRRLINDDCLRVGCNFGTC
jgi:hypothetical protein